MDEHFTAIIVSLITGTLGLIGVYISSVWAKSKSEKITQSNQVVASKAINECLDIPDYCAQIILLLREQRIELKESVSEVKVLSREQTLNVCEELDEIKRLLKGLNK